MLPIIRGSKAAVFMCASFHQLSIIPVQVARAPFPKHHDVRYGLT